VARKLFLGLGFAFLFGLSLLGSPPTVLQPNTGSYSAAEVAEITTAINALDAILGDTTLGPNKKLGEYLWATSLDFAAYTAGLLAGRGYTTRLVAQAGWPDGRHVWVLVGIPVAGKLAWTPVEATPAPGEPQRVLGSLPLRADESGQLWFSNAYLHPSDEISLPANLPPIAQASFAPSRGMVGAAMTFLGTSSRDPDGEILHYLWTFGDGTTGRGSKIDHSYVEPEVYMTTLTVIDNRGASQTVEIHFTVGKSCSCGG